MTWGLMPFPWRKMTWSLAKAEAYKGKRKVKDWWEEETLWSGTPGCWWCPLYLMKNQWTWCSSVLHWNQLFVITPAKGTPLSMVVQAKQAWCTPTTLEEHTPENSETEKAPQSVNYLPMAQWQTAEPPLHWVNRKLCTILWMFSWASLLHQGWKVQFWGTGNVRESTLVFQW